MNVAAVLILGALLVALAWRFSARSIGDASRVALVAVLGVTASAFNVVVPIASVEVTTTVVLCVAIALGARLGVAVAVVCLLGSSLAGGVGGWTPWQLAGWSVTAMIGAGAGSITRRRQVDWFAPAAAVTLCLLTAVAATAYDLVVTVPTAVLLAAPGRELETIAAQLLLGAAFTVTHVVFSATFSVLGGPPLLHALARARPRLDGGRILAAPPARPA